MTEEKRRTEGTNDKEKWEKDFKKKKRGGLLDQQGALLFLSSTLSFSVVSHLAHMTPAVRLKSPLRSALKQTRLIVTPSETECGSQTFHLSVVIFH